MLRKAEFNDCQKIYELICDMENKQFQYDTFSKIFQKQMNHSNYYCLVYETDKRVIGVINLRVEEQLHHCEKIAEVMEFAVQKNYRKQGVGKKLFEYACEMMRNVGCSQIELATNQLRKDAHRFYVREGMKNYHFKFSKSLINKTPENNVIGV